MLNKKIPVALTVAGCFFFNAASAGAAAQVVVSNKPLSVASAERGVYYTKEDNLTKDARTGKVLTPKELRKLEKERQKALKKAKKEREKAERKRLKEEKKAAEKAAKERKKQEKERKNNPAPVQETKKADGGKAYYAGIELPRDYKNISIYGEAQAAKSQAVALIKANNPTVRLACSIEELVDLYWEEAEREGVRPDLALSQALIETGYFRYGGDVKHHQNNFCGLGTTGNGVKGASFATPQLGVRAHIQHLLAYTQRKRPSTPIVDPRYELAHSIRLERGVVDTWYGLNGTWAMGSSYCEKIMATYQKMLAMEISEADKEKMRRQEAQIKRDNDKNAHRQDTHKMRRLVEELLRDK